MKYSNFTNHLSIEISLESLKGDWTTKELAAGIKIPNRAFPKPFFIVNDKNICAGYTASYDGVLNEQEVLTICQTGNWKKLVDKIADLFVIFLDTQTKKIYIFTGQMGKFPCYYAISDGNLLVSTSFSWVNQHLKTKHISLEGVGEHLIGYMASYPFDQTVISEIKHLPPATLLELDETMKIKIEPIFSLNDLKSEETPYLSREKFTDEVVQTGIDVVRGYSEAVKGLSVGAELSSGFDSSWVNYLLKKANITDFTSFTGFSKYLKGETDTATVTNFCKKHGLESQFIDVSEMYPFAQVSSKENKTGNYMIDYSYDRFWGMNKVLAEKFGTAVLFAGHGGDELYGSYLTEWDKYPIQMTYFSEIRNLLSSGRKRVFTDKAIEIIYDPSRFGRKRFYPNDISSSALAVGQLFFPCFWEVGLWLLMPLADPRLVKLFRKMPISMRKGNIREQMWKPRSDIFIPEQFVHKMSSLNLWNRFLYEKKDFLIKVLSDSVLQEIRMIKLDEAIKALKQQDTKYLNYIGVPMVIQAVVQLELFFREQTGLILG